MVFGKRGEFRGGGISKKKMQTSQIPYQIESMQEVSYKLDNGKGFKNRGKIRDRNLDQLTDV